MYSVNDLVGLEIKKAYDSDGGIVLVTNKGIVQLSPEGDCCARCYITDIDGSECLLGNVKEVESLTRPEVPADECNDVSDVWGHRIHTDNGICTIGMRVDHNGYYGGSLTACKGHDDLESYGDIKPLEDFA